jgi:DNA-binding FadR family transcriptional regulator
LVTVSVALRQPAYQALADDLRKQITSGRLRPGDRLPTEPQLCASSGVSRSTVREALRLLASQNLIVTTRGTTGGSFVAHPSPDQVSRTLATGVGMLLLSAEVTVPELLEVRALLEVPGARMAARRRTEADLAAMEATLVDPDQPIEALLAAHNAFHRAVADAAGNPLFQVVSGPLYRLSNEVELAARAHPRTWVRVDAEHRAILAGIAVADPDAAEAAAAAHIVHLQEAFAEL